MKRFTEESLECRKNLTYWLKIVDILEFEGGGDRSNPESSCVMLHRALKCIPLHDPGHKDVLSRLFMNLLTTVSKASD